MDRTDRIYAEANEKAENGTLTYLEASKWIAEMLAKKRNM